MISPSSLRFLHLTDLHHYPPRGVWNDAGEGQVPGGGDKRFYVSKKANFFTNAKKKIKSSNVIQISPPSHLHSQPRAPPPFAKTHDFSAPKGG